MSERILIDTSDDPEDRPGSGSPRWAAGALALVMVLAGGAFLLASSGSEPEPETLAAPIEPFRPPTGTWVERRFDGDGGFTDSAQGPPGLVAVGTGRSVGSVPFAWHTADGAAWTPAVTRWGEGEALSSVVFFDDGFLAAGHAPIEPGRYEATRPTVWRSLDGVEWHPVATQGLPDEGVIVGMAVSGGTLTAIGWEGPAVLEPTTPPGADASGRVWRSPDGVTWIDRTPEGSGLWFAGVATGPAVLVVAGAAGDRPAVWIDEGGDDWTRHVLVDRPLQPEVASAVDVTANGVLAVSRPRHDVEGLAHVWMVRGDGTIAEVWEEGRPTAAGWIESTDRGLFAGPGFTRSSFPTGPELWVSGGGADWVGVELTRGRSPWPPTIVTGVSSFGEKILAFGSRGGAPVGWALEDD